MDYLTAKSGGEPVGKALAQVGDIVLLGEASEFQPDRGTGLEAHTEDCLSRRCTSRGIDEKRSATSRKSFDSLMPSSSVAGVPT